MKRIKWLILFTVFLAAMFATAGIAADSRVVYDKSVPLQGYVCNPSRHLGTVTAGKVLRMGTGGDYDISGWLAIGLWPQSDGYVTLNGDVNKKLPVSGGDLKVYLLHPGVTQVVPSVDVVVCGM